MRHFILIFALGLGACTAQDPGSGRAHFATFPESLFDALGEACTAPSQTLVRPQRETVECREFLPPGPTAAIILAHDGTPQALPQLVIRFEATPVSDGYAVENQVYLDVPRTDGSVLKVVQRDRDLSRMLDRLYRRAGGTPG